MDYFPVNMPRKGWTEAGWAVVPAETARALCAMELAHVRAHPCCVVSHCNCVVASIYTQHQHIQSTFVQIPGVATALLPPFSPPSHYYNELSGDAPSDSTQGERTIEETGRKVQKVRAKTYTRIEKGTPPLDQLRCI